MSPKRIKQRFSDFQKAVSRLDEILKEDMSKTSAIVDGTIQRFEFTFELAWKLAKDILSYKGIEVDSPRSCIKEAFQAGLFQNGEDWINMLEDRNKAAHVYDEETAEQVSFDIIRDFSTIEVVVERLGCELDRGGE